MSMRQSKRCAYVCAHELECVHIPNVGAYTCFDGFVHAAQGMEGIALQPMKREPSDSAEISPR
jgi:hypothetical protein